MDYISLEVADGIGKITLNRPQVFNSFNHAMRLELQQALAECDQPEHVRVVYLTGAGRAFCAGQDIAEITGDQNPGFKKILSEGFNPIVAKIRSMAVPVVCAVNGVAAGAGANIALACDITVAAASASFTQAFSKIGLVPDSGGSWTLPRLVGIQKAMALTMLSDKITATEAAEMGMIWKAIPDETFAEESLSLAKTLANMPTQALILTKKALNESFSNNFEQQLALEDQYQTQAGSTADYREGIAAFMEKRRPVFIGK